MYEMNAWLGLRLTADCEQSNFLSTTTTLTLICQSQLSYEFEENVHSFPNHWIVWVMCT